MKEQNNNIIYILKESYNYETCFANMATWKLYKIVCSTKVTLHDSFTYLIKYLN